MHIYFWPALGTPLGRPWVRPWDNRGKCHMDEKIRWPTSANLYIDAVTTQQFVVLSLTTLFPQNLLYGESMATPVNYAYSVAILMLSHNNISQAIFYTISSLYVQCPTQTPCIALTVCVRGVSRLGWTTYLYARTTEAVPRWVSD